MANKRILLKKHLGKKYISITALEYSDSDSQKETLDEVAKLSTKNNCYKLLIDARPLKKYPPTENIFRFGEKLISINKLNQGRVAWITGNPELAGFISNVMYNRGVNISIFNNMDDAKKWLFS
jgi:hypothetical protein